MQELVGGVLAWRILLIPLRSRPAQIPKTVIDDILVDTDMQVDQNKEARVLETSSGSSPEKKRQTVDQIKNDPKVDDEPRIKSGVTGPCPSSAVRDCGGSGDCGRRTLAYLVAMTNSKWQSLPCEIRDKLDALSKSLHSKAVSWLLNTDLSWTESWAVDPLATEETERGAIAQNLTDFKTSLRRQQRWI